MVYGILLIGLALLSSGLKGTQHELGQQLQSDFLGAGGFIAWIGAVLALGAIGWLPGLRSTSRYLIVLLGIVLLVRNGGIWQQAQLAITQASVAGPAPSTKLLPAAGSAGSAGASTGSSGASDAAGVIGAVTSVAKLAALF